MQHDWYSHSNGDVVYVVDSGTQLLEDGSVVEFSNLVAFNDYQELREWAGY